jgi:8-oxo-dGTP pyrophosphatase MutT (NUDIX family)
VRRETIAKVLIFNQNYDVLVLQIGTHKLYPEMIEETGLRLQTNAISLLHASTYQASQKSVTKLLYAAYLEDSPSITLSWEHEAYRWIDIEQLLGEPTFTTYREAVMYVRDSFLKEE